MFSEDPGTFLFGSDWNMLDQFLASKELLHDDGWHVVPGATTIFKPDLMTIGAGNKRPRRFGRPSKDSTFDIQGFSDHFPIQTRLST